MYKTTDRRTDVHQRPFHPGPRTRRNHGLTPLSRTLQEWRSANKIRAGGRPFNLQEWFVDANIKAGVRFQRKASVFNEASFSINGVRRIEFCARSDHNETSGRGPAPATARGKRGPQPILCTKWPQYEIILRPRARSGHRPGYAGAQTIVSSKRVSFVEKLSAAALPATLL